MKKYTILLIVSMLVFLSACEKQLEIEPHEIYYDNFYQTEDDALTAINAAYSVLSYVSQYSNNIWLVQDISSDDCNARSNLNDPYLHQFNNYTLNANNNYLAEIWENSYLGISRANVVLDRVPDISMDSTIQLRILGEAKFLRALFYFNLVRMFGDVPLVLLPLSPDMTDEELYPSREDKMKVYDQIIKDFSEASEQLPEAYFLNEDKGRATKGAALGLLSKVYLRLEDWNMAANTALEVISLNQYQLFADYAANFKEINKNGKESVFEIQFYSTDVALNSQMVISGLPSILGTFDAGVEIMLPTEDLLNSFEEGDYRYEVSFFDHYWYDNFEPHIWKFWDQDAYEPDQTSESGADFFVMRYSEILLIYAEALNEANGGPTTEAYEAINTVRGRARNGVADVLPDLEGLMQEDFRKAVLAERRHEFVNEGMRWFDLTRTGNLVEFVKLAKGDQSNPQDFNYLFPVPQRERSVNASLSQNTGY
jgi:starch-binding outer membrane protein, SusD/RagB family